METNNPISLHREAMEPRSHPSANQMDPFAPHLHESSSSPYSVQNSPYFLWGEKKMALPPLSFRPSPPPSHSPLPSSSSSSPAPSLPYPPSFPSFPSQFSSVSSVSHYSFTSPTLQESTAKRNRSLGTLQLLPRLISALDSLNLHDNAVQIISTHAPHLVKIDESKRVTYDFMKIEIKTQHTLEKMLSDLLASHNPNDPTLSDPNLYTGIVLPWMDAPSSSSSEPQSRAPIYNRTHYPHFAPHYHHPNENRGGMHSSSSSSFQASYYPSPYSFKDEHDSNRNRIGIPPLRMYQSPEERFQPSNFRSFDDISQHNPLIPKSNSPSTTPYAHNAENNYISTSNNKRSRTSQPSDLDHLIGAAKKESIEDESKSARDLLFNLKNKHNEKDDDKNSSDSEYNSFQLNSKGGWDCDRCDKTFDDKEGLIKHFRIHNSEKPYVCKECGRGFRHTGSLKDHLFIHSGLKPYKCDIEGCNKSFSQASNLRRHKRIHTGEKPYVCPHCDKAFNQSSNMKQHILGHTAGRY